MSANFLKEVLKTTRRRVAYLKENGFKSCFPSRSPRRNFRSAIKRVNAIRIIAEAKRSSPSAGVIVRNYDPVKLCTVYQNSGCDALSVLTEPHFFGGSIADLKNVKENTRVPVLRKDFIIDPIQIHQSRYYGADAVLLICKIVDIERLKKLYSLARKLGLEALVEVFDEEDLEKALKLDCPVIGINNRNLDTLRVDINNTFRLLRKIPKKKIVVGESGVKNRNQVLRLKRAGVDALLIGESFLRQKNPSRKIKELKGIK